jgi:WD40 repeat protein
MKILRKISGVLLVTLISLTAYGQGIYPELLPHSATGFAWSPQGDRYATGHFNGDIRIYDNGLIAHVIPSAHTELILTLAFSPDGRRLVTGAIDDDVRVWNTDTGALLKEFSDVGGVISNVDWSPHGNLIFVTPFGVGNFIVSADIATDSYFISQTTELHASEGIAWNPESTAIAVGGYLNDLSILGLDVANVETRMLDSTPNSDPMNPTNEFITSVVWHPTANIVADGKINGRVIIWDLDDPSDTVPFHSLEGNNGAADDAVIPFYHRIIDISFSADGRTISSVSMDGTLRTWDVGTGELLLDTNLGEQVLSGAFSPDGSQLVYSTYSTTDIPPTLINLPLPIADKRDSGIIP